MPRNYKPKMGTRPYRNFNSTDMEAALQAVADGMALRQASRQYNVPLMTLSNRFNGKCFAERAGRPTVFTRIEEEEILKAVAACGDWGFPLTKFDLRLFGKHYLDSDGRVENRFQNNMPGSDWADSLLKRHKSSFSQKVASNIKRNRAAVTPEALLEFYNNVKETIGDAPPCNVFNYDETNVSDNPGKSKAIYRRTVKYPEKVLNFSKSATSVMFCGSADGTCLPPYVIYKSTHLYNTWKEGGPVGYPCCHNPCCGRGTRFNRTLSGWIDSPTFRDWFETSFLPHAKRLPGKKILVGDNLSSHFDPVVLKLCQENEIEFVCLVPNSSHLTQPLDVGFFRPFKGAWRKTLLDWKQKNLRQATVPKESFPRLLRNTLLEMDCNNKTKESGMIKKDLISAFAASGIYPVNAAPVLKRLPNQQNREEVAEGVASNLISFLEAKRFGDRDAALKRQRRSKLAVEPGKSCGVISSDDEEEEISDKDESANSSDQNVDTAQSASDSEEEQIKLDELHNGDFVVAEYNLKGRGKSTVKKNYVGEILDHNNDRYNIKFMKKRGLSYIFPDVDDVDEITGDMIKKKLKPPKIRRSMHYFSDL